MARTRRGQTPPPTNPNNMTPEAVQTMIGQALMRNSSGRDGSHSSHTKNPRNMHTVRPCYYADFMKCHPLNFKGRVGQPEGQLPVLETHARRLEWQRQAVDDLAVQHIMCTQALEHGARDDTLEDTGSSS
nr:hypothetical protein [Tanacetum cinerariifolium]